ncbi:Ketosteroid isomerase-related protein [Sphingopyxis sp. LC81]|uniref:nuclear transport factor 2 family protein n=1 Tax=Sphingopyxis sp. LC81 TaxID=1502850 RepID=UPI00051014B3|nr:nuclear transport factor 2 family protein [Sphingopyxis sp. LC81]KGB54416.1 Ketosteroid isomerase-related protein [Sphingopyxis sp. LC81]
MSDPAAAGGEDEVRRVLEAYAAAWKSGDLAAIAALYHDDFTLHYGGANALSGVHAGKVAALAVLADFSRRTGRRLLDIVDVMAGPRRGAIVARERLGLGDAAVEVERLLVYTVADGLLRECWVYDADQALIDRLIGPA